MGEAETIRLRPIGFAHTNASDEETRAKPEGFEGTVEILPQFEDALDGLKGFSHLLVISYFDRLRPEQIGPLKVKPRRLLEAGLRLEDLPLVGVFSVDSPTRPNPIGLTLVRLIKVEGRILRVSGLDLFDGTPILDVKAYLQQYRAGDYSMAEWYAKLLEKARRL